MPRRGNEPVGDWHARATNDYLNAATEAAARRSRYDDGREPAEPDANKAFADWYAAAKAFLAENARSGTGTPSAHDRCKAVKAGVSPQFSPAVSADMGSNVFDRRSQ